MVLRPMLGAPQAARSETPSRTRILIDVSTIWGMQGEKWSGIPRVEFEVARTLIRQGATPVLFDSDTGDFVTLTPSDFAEAFEGGKTQTINELYLLPREQDARSSLRLAALWALWVLTLAVGPHRASGRRLHSFAVRLFGYVSPALAGNARRRWVRLLRIDRSRSDQEAVLQANGRRRSEIRKARFAGRNLAFGPDDLLFLLGATWEFHDLARVERLKAESGMRVVSLVYDLVPVRHPELQSPAGAFVQRFERYLHQAIRLSDRLAAISTFVAQDVANYAREQGLACPPVTPIPLCSELSASSASEFSVRLRSLPLKPGRFALFVSTFNPRKNQLWAYKLWKRSIAPLLADPFPLVLAGQRGWLSDDLFMIMQRDPEIWNRHVIYVEAPSDGELVWLYRNCAFTIYPSEFEGWGLPITESLTFGKYCLAADNTSLREASQDLAFHADPFDGPAWTAEIRRLIEDPALLATKSGMTQRFVKRTWSDFGQDLLAIADELDADSRARENSRRGA